VRKVAGQHAQQDDSLVTDPICAELGIPSSRWSWAGPSVSPAALWWAPFLALQLTALLVVLALDPGGLDPCDPAGKGPRGLQAAIAGVAILGSAAHAGWRVRGRALVAAAATVGLATICWFGLLNDAGTTC
jgi:hypothetical protein